MDRATFEKTVADMAAEQRTRRLSGGPWRLYIALPGRKAPTYLKGSYPTEAAAQELPTANDLDAEEDAERDRLRAITVGA